MEQEKKERNRIEKGTTEIGKGPRGTKWNGKRVVLEYDQGGTKWSGTGNIVTGTQKEERNGIKLETRGIRMRKRRPKWNETGNACSWNPKKRNEMEWSGERVKLEHDQEERNLMKEKVLLIISITIIEIGNRV